MDIGAYVCSRVNRYKVGEILSASVFTVHLLTMITDAIMRCTKTKGFLRSLVRFFTVSLIKHMIILCIDCELQGTWRAYHSCVYSLTGVGGEAFGDSELLGSLPC